MRLRLSIQVAPLPLRGPTNSLFPGLTYRRPQEFAQKFVHLAEPEVTVGELWRQIEQAYTTKYLTQSDYGQFQIKKLQDEDYSDLDNNYTLGELFDGQNGPKIIKVVQCYADRESSIPVTSTLRPKGPSPFKRPLPPVPLFDSNKRRKTEHEHEPELAPNQYLDVHPDRPVRSTERDLGDDELGEPDIGFGSTRKRSRAHGVSRRGVQEEQLIQDSEDEREHERQARHRELAIPSEGHFQRNEEYSRSEDAVSSDEDFDEVHENDLSEADEIEAVKSPKLNPEHGDDGTKNNGRHWNSFATPAYPASKARQHSSTSSEHNRQGILVSPEFPQSSAPVKSRMSKPHSRLDAGSNDFADLHQRRFSREKTPHRSSEHDSDQNGTGNRVSRSARLSSPTPSIQIIAEIKRDHAPARTAQDVKSSTPVTAAKSLERIMARRLSRGENPDLAQSPEPRMTEPNLSLARSKNSPRSGHPSARKILAPQLSPDLHGKDVLVETNLTQGDDAQMISVSPKIQEQLERTQRIIAREIAANTTSPDPKPGILKRKTTTISPILPRSSSPQVTARSPIQENNHPGRTTSGPGADTSSIVEADEVDAARTSPEVGVPNIPRIFYDRHGIDHSSPMEHVKALSQQALLSDQIEPVLTQLNQGTEAHHVQLGVPSKHDALTFQYIRNERAKQAVRSASETVAAINESPVQAGEYLPGRSTEVQVAASPKPKSVANNGIEGRRKLQHGTSTEDSEAILAMLKDTLASIEDDQIAQSVEGKRGMQENEERPGQAALDEPWSFSRIDQTVPVPRRVSFTPTPTVIPHVSQQSRNANPRRLSGRISASPLGEVAASNTQSSHAASNNVSVVISSSKEGDEQRLSIPISEIMSGSLSELNTPLSQVDTIEDPANDVRSNSNDLFEHPVDDSQLRKRRKLPDGGFRASDEDSVKRTTQNPIPASSEAHSSKGTSKLKAKKGEPDKQPKKRARKATTAGQDDAATETVSQQQASVQRQSFTAINNQSPSEHPAQSNVHIRRRSESSKSGSPLELRTNHKALQTTFSKSPGATTTMQEEMSPAVASKSPIEMEQAMSPPVRKSTSKSPTVARKAALSRETTHDSQETRDDEATAELVEVVTREQHLGDNSVISDQQPARYLPSSSEEDEQSETDDQESGTVVSSEDASNDREPWSDVAIPTNEIENTRTLPMAPNEQRSSSEISLESTPSQSESLNAQLDSQLQKDAESSTQPRRRISNESVDMRIGSGSPNGTPPAVGATPHLATSKRSELRKERPSSKLANVKANPPASIRKGSSSDSTGNSSTPGSLKRPTQPIVNMANPKANATKLSKKASPTITSAKASTLKDSKDSGVESISDSQIDSESARRSNATIEDQKSPTKIDVSQDSSSGSSSEGDEDSEAEDIVNKRPDRQPVKQPKAVAKARKTPTKRAVSKISGRSSEEDNDRDSDADSIRDSQIDRKTTKAASSGILKKTPAKATPVPPKSSTYTAKTPTSILKTGPQFLDPKTPAKKGTTAKAGVQSSTASTSTASGTKSKTVVTTTSVVPKSSQSGVVSTPTSYQKPSAASAATTAKSANPTTPAPKPRANAKPTLPTSGPATTSRIKSNPTTKSTNPANTKPALRAVSPPSSSVSSTSDEEDSSSSDEDSQPETLAEEAAREALLQRAEARATASGKEFGSKEKKNWNLVYKRE